MVAAVVGCAEVGRPPGGPVDDTPPILVDSRPDSLATGVPRDAPLHLLFSEKVDRRSVTRAIRFLPDVEVQNPRFRDRVVTLRPVDGWPADSVVVWSVGVELKDKHGVALALPAQGAFTTGDQLPVGRIRGSAAVEGEDGAKGPIRANLTLPPPEGSRKAALWRWALADSSGRFELDLLDTPSGPYDLSVFLDRNGNGSRDEREPVATLDSLFLASTDSILLLDRLELIDLEGPVALAVCVDVTWPDSLRVYASYEPEEGNPQKAALDSTGCATTQQVPGRLRIAAWQDLDGDGTFGPDSTGTSEPFLEPRDWELEPARPDSLHLDGAWTTMAWTVLDTLRPPPLPRELFTKGTP